jgi:hypothetical protein
MKDSTANESKIMAALEKTPARETRKSIDITDSAIIK